MKLSDRALAVVLSGVNGFTVNPRTGDVPASGYMVAMPDHTHLVKHSQVLSTVNALTEDPVFDLPDVWLGGWWHDGMVYLEPAVNVANREDALLLGRVWEQVSVWDVAGERELDPATGDVRAAA